jgi:N-ethylmaleimide reductase
MSSLFESLRLGPLTLPNRIIMAPMTRSRANDAGVVSDLTAEYYRQRASAGLIISEGIFPSAMGKGYVRTPGLATAEQVAGWKKVTGAVHQAGGRIFAQLMHVGRISHPALLPNGAQPVAPSAVQPKGQVYTDQGMLDWPEPRALSTSEIQQIVEEFKQATRNAFEAGFDGVELHSASGYLPMQFLSSGSNQRTDQYGGSAANRVRFVVETLEAMASVKGPQYVGIKISPEMAFNDIQDANPAETYETLTRAIAPLNLAYLHVAAYGKEVDYHKLLRPLFPGVYMVGSQFTKASGEQMLASGGADAIVYGNLFLANPDLPARFKKDTALNEPDRNTFYAGGAKGYTDYPALP